MSDAYINRPLANSILSDHHKVVIVEGARAVGKTMMAKQQIAGSGFAYRSLVDEEVYRYASQNPTSWFKTLPDKVIIDEAQRIKELPLLIKEAADESTNPGPRYILTGSASIGKSSLDGQDPLVRRASRFTLSPLTQREIHDVRGSIIDDLWDAEINESFTGSCPRREIMRLMSIGGFPQYVTSASIISPNERSLSIRSDISHILGSTVVPGERLDSHIADSVLQTLLSLPGNILNVNRIAKMTGRDTRTVTSYISVLENRFLIRHLRNQRLAAAKQEFTRAKIHPVDPSFSMETFLRSGKDVSSDPVLFGYVLESFIASQLLPAVEWSAVHPDAFFWREAGSAPKEVDFVFMRDGKALAVEVKSAEIVDSSDFKNIRAFAERHELVRGFVVYTGRTIVRESENMWAIPVDALWGHDAFNRKREARGDVALSARSLARIASETRGRHSAGMDSVANIFLSYNHDDNEHLENGIIQFVERVIKEYEFSYGATLTLFVDVQSIKWGEDWRRALDRAVETTNFLMPAVTPRYVLSASCRDELFKFFERIETDHHGHVLSMIWQPVDEMVLDAGAAKARKIIDDHQYLQLAGLRDSEPSEKAYKALVRTAAQKLHDVIQAQGAAPIPPRAEQFTPEEETGGLLEQLDEANASIETLQSCIAGALDSVNGIAVVLNSHPAPTGSKAGSFSSWGARVSKAAEPDVVRLNRNLDEVEDAWSTVRKLMGSYLEIAPALGDDAHEAVMISLQQLRQQMQVSADMDLLANELGAVRSLSPKLAPMSKAMGRLLDVIRGIAGSIDELVSRGG